MSGRFAAVALFGVLATLRVDPHYPSRPSPLTLELPLEGGQPGCANPVIVAGPTSTGDSLGVRLVDAHTIALIARQRGRQSNSPRDDEPRFRSNAIRVACRHARLHLDPFDDRSLFLPT